MSSQIQTFYVRYLYQNVSHINRFLFLTRYHKWQRLHREVVTFIPVKDSYFFRQCRFNGLFEITPYIILIARLAITDFDTFLFLQIGGSPSSMYNPPNNSLTLIQLEFSNNTPSPSPAKFQEKERKKTKKIKTETTQSHYVSLTFLVCAAKYGVETWNSVQNNRDRNGENFWHRTFTFMHVLMRISGMD